MIYQVNNLVTGFRKGFHERENAEQYRDFINASYGESAAGGPHAEIEELEDE